MLVMLSRLILFPFYVVYDVEISLCNIMFPPLIPHPNLFSHSLLTVSMLKHPRTPPTNSLAMDYQTADSESVLKRPRPFGISDGVLTAAYSFFILRFHPQHHKSSQFSLNILQVNNLPVNVLPVTYPGQSHSHAAYSTDDLPKNVSRVLSQGSAIKSMDFHPVQQTMLLG